MPHQCVRCSKFHDDGASEILKGCSCGGKLFFFVKKEKLEQARKVLPDSLDTKQREQIEHDVRELTGQLDDEVPVVLDLESIKIAEPGKYQIDLVHLFQNEPLVFKLEEGKYMIDLNESFGRLKKK